MRTANPALNAKTFVNTGGVMQSTTAMTVQGTATKTFVLLVCLMLTASYVWNLFFSAGDPAAGAASVMPWLWGVRVDGDPGLAVPGDFASAVQTAESPISTVAGT